MDKLQLSEKDLKDLESRLKEGKSKLEEFVKEYPTTSVVVAFLIGFFLAKKFNNKG